MGGETRELSFELERFEWVSEDRLEVSGRWTGLSGRRLARPVLTVEADGRRRRLTALPGGQMPAKGSDEPWRATFAWSHGPADIEFAELEVGRNVVVDLPAPRRRKRRSGGASPSRDEALRTELAELRAQVAELRRAGGEEPEPAAQPPAEPDPELLAQLSALRAEAEHVTGERDGLREELERADADRATVREELAHVRSEKDTLDDQHAALIARSGDLRGQLAEAIDAQEPLSEELRVLREAKQAADADRERLERELAAARETLAQREKELAGHREVSEQRLGVERSALTVVRGKLASAREGAP
jgi:hypothetical protein